MFRCALIVVVLAAAGVAGCSSDSGPAPGGINGPARVEPNPGANNPADDTGG